MTIFPKQFIRDSGMRRIERMTAQQQAELDALQSQLQASLPQQTLPEVAVPAGPDPYAVETGAPEVPALGVPTLPAEEGAEGATLQGAIAQGGPPMEVPGQGAALMAPMAQSGGGLQGIGAQTDLGLGASVEPGQLDLTTPEGLGDYDLDTSGLEDLYASADEDYARAMEELEATYQQADYDTDIGLSNAAPSGPGNANVRRWNDLIIGAAAKYNIPASVIAGTMDHESGGNPNAVSSAGAQGLMQVMPFHFSGDEAGRMQDPAVNIDKGAKILADNYRRYGSWDKAVAAYFGAIDANGNITDASDGGTTGNAYVQSFMDRRGRYIDMDQVTQGAGRFFNEAGEFIKGKAGDLRKMFEGSLTPDQMGMQNYFEAVRSCGPAAVAAFLARAGRMPNLEEIQDLAQRKNLWFEGGMRGPDAQVALMAEYGIKATLERGNPTPDRILRDLAAGNPVTISTPAHYFTVEGFDPSTGKFDVGRSGTVMANYGGKELMTLAEIAEVGGGIQGAIYADNPLSDGVSYANDAQSDDLNVDESISDYAHRREKGILDQFKDSFSQLGLDVTAGLSERTKSLWGDLGMGVSDAIARAGGDQFLGESMALDPVTGMPENQRPDFNLSAAAEALDGAIDAVLDRGSRVVGGLASEFGGAYERGIQGRREQETRQQAALGNLDYNPETDRRPFMLDELSETAAGASEVGMSLFDPLIGAFKGATSGTPVSTEAMGVDTPMGRIGLAEVANLAAQFKQPNRLGGAGMFARADPEQQRSLGEAIRLVTRKGAEIDLGEAFRRAPEAAVNMVRAAGDRLSSDALEVRDAVSGAIEATIRTIGGPPPGAGLTPAFAGEGPMFPGPVSRVLDEPVPTRQDQMSAPDQAARAAPEEAPEDAARRHRESVGVPQAYAHAQEYTRQFMGHELSEAGGRRAADPEFQARVADDYDRLPNAPDDPRVRAAYGQMAREVNQQYKFLKSKGVRFEPFDGADPYEAGGALNPDGIRKSDAMRRDVRENNHLAVYAGEDGHPLLNPNNAFGEASDNWKFRAVHDYFGHAAEGNNFAAGGEENAWQAHARMFSREARAAMTTETRGQNSWVNFGAHLRNQEGRVPGKGEEGYVPPTERPFAQQKAGILPEEYWDAAAVRAEISGMTPARAAREFGGATYDTKTGLHYDPESGGYAVSNAGGIDSLVLRADSKNPMRISSNYVTGKDRSLEANIAKFVAEHKAVLDQPGNFLGIWRKEGSGADAGATFWHLDVSTIHDDPREALWTAYQRRGELRGTTGDKQKATFVGYDMAGKQDVAFPGGLRTAADTSTRFNPDKPFVTNHRGERLNFDSALEYEQYKQYERKMAVGEIRDWGRAGPEFVMPYVRADATGARTITGYFTPDTWYIDRDGRFVLNELKSDNFRGYQTNLAKEEMLGYNKIGAIVPIEDTAFAFPENVRPPGPVYIKFTNERALVAAESGDIRANLQRDLDEYRAQYGDVVGPDAVEAFASNMRSIATVGNRDVIGTRFPGGMEDFRARMNADWDEALEVERGYTDLESEGGPRTYGPYQNSPRGAGVKGRILTNLEAAREAGMVPEPSRPLPHVFEGTPRDPETGGPILGGTRLWGLGASGAGLAGDEDEEMDPWEAGLLAAGAVASMNPARAQRIVQAWSRRPKALPQGTPQDPQSLASRVMYNSMLGRTTTMLANIATGALEVTWKLATDAVRQNPKTTAHEIVAAADGALSGLESAIQVLRYGYSDVMIDRAAAQGKPLSTSSVAPGALGNYGPIGTALAAPTRALAAGDEFFYNITYSMEATRKAYALARESGFQGPDISAMAKTLIQGNDHEVVEAAKRAADLATFRNELGPSGKGFESWVKNRAAISWAVPFVHAVLNIYARSAERTPGLGALPGMHRSDMSPGELKATQGIALGLAVSAVGMHSAGILTGAGPRDVQERKRLERDGWQPYSIKIGGQYRDIRNLGPAAVPLLQTAVALDSLKYGHDTAIQERAEFLAVDPARRVDMPFDENASKREAFYNAVSGLVRMAGDQSALSGLFDIIELGGSAIGGDPTQGIERFAARGISRYIPFGGAASQVASASDPSRRDPEGVGEHIAQGIPGLRQQIPPQLDPYGREVPNPQQGREAFLPFRAGGFPRKAAAEQALEQYGIETVDREVKKIGDRELSREERFVHRGMNGAMKEAFVNRVMSSQDFASASEPQKQALLQGAVAAAKRSADDTVVPYEKRKAMKDAGEPWKYYDVNNFEQERRIDVAISRVRAWETAINNFEDMPEPPGWMFDLAFEYEDLLTDEYVEYMRGQRSATRRGGY